MNLKIIPHIRKRLIVECTECNKITYATCLDEITASNLNTFIIELEEEGWEYKDDKSVKGLFCPNCQ